MKQAPPAVVDIRNGDWQFAYKGEVVKRALYEKAGLLEQEYTDILNHIQSEFGSEATVPAVIAAFVQTFTSSKSWRADTLATMCSQAARVQEEILSCRRAANGFHDDLIYKMGLEDLEKLGLGLVGQGVL